MYATALLFNIYRKRFIWHLQSSKRLPNKCISSKQLQQIHKETVCHPKTSVQNLAIHHISYHPKKIHRHLLDTQHPTYIKKTGTQLALVMKDVSLRYQSLGVPRSRGGTFVEGAGGRVSSQRDWDSKIAGEGF